LVSAVILIHAPGRRGAGLGDGFVDLLDRQARAVRLVLENALQVAPGSLAPFGLQLRPTVRQQVQMNLVARSDAEVLEHVFPEGHLAPGRDGQGRHGGGLRLKTVQVMQNHLIFKAEARAFGPSP
jgi:hypothetical protein